MTDPLQRIFEYMDQILQCREYPGPDKVGAQIGELDAATEIHRLVEEWKEQRG